MNTASSAMKHVNEAQETIRETLLNTMMKRLTDDEARSLAEHWGYIESKVTQEAQQAERVQKKEKKEEVVENPYARFMEEVGISTGETHFLHEHLGELVLDLGYKKVYRTSVMNLSRTPVWEKQRILRPNRSRAIVNEKITKKSMHLPGVLTMFQDKNGRTGIIDGQHRAAALVILAQEGHWDPYARNIMVDVFSIDGDDEEVMNLFVEINRAEPVRLIDMPTRDLVSTKMKVAIDEVVDRLQDENPSMFGGARCRVPNLNADKFRDELFQSQFMPRSNLRAAKQLLQSPGCRLQYSRFFFT